LDHRGRELQQVDARTLGTRTARRGPSPVSSTVRPTQPRRRRSQTRAMKRWAVWLVCAVIAAGLVAWRSNDLSALRVALPPLIEQAWISAGFGLDEVTVSGHRFTADADIFDALDLPHVKTITALDATRVQAQLQRLPWVESATIARVYPGRAHVHVTERAAFAVWVREQTGVLIDSAGRTLSAVGLSDAPGLPRIAGEGAPEAAPALFATLNHFEAIRSRLVVAQRVTMRRWSLMLTNGIRLELPSEGEATAMSDLLKDDAGRSLLARPNVIIDLRSRSQIAWRPTGAT
jgi:cell division protein FtsQ